VIMFAPSLGGVETPPFMEDLNSEDGGRVYAE